MTKVSVVIPLYNKEKHIKRAIDSIFAQTVQDFELIVVDDGSTDKGAEVVKAIKDYRLRLIQQINQGECAARNKGIDEAKEDLIAFLDADDAWKPKFLETILRLRSNYPDVGAYATAYEMKEPNGRILRPKFKTIPPYPWEGIIPNYFEAALDSFIVWSSATSIPKSVFDVVGKFPEGEKIGGDLDMWLRIALKYKIAYSSSIESVYYRDAMNRACNQYSNLNGYRIVKTIDEAITNRVMNVHTRELLIEMKAQRILESAAQCIVALKPKLSREFLKKCKTKRFLLVKLYWQFWAYCPLALIKASLYIKHIINKYANRN